jgi:hypothetical protein
VPIELNGVGCPNSSRPVCKRPTPGRGVGRPKLSAQACRHRLVYPALADPVSGDRPSPDRVCIDFLVLGDVSFTSASIAKVTQYAIMSSNRSQGRLAGVGDKRLTRSTTGAYAEGHRSATRQFLQLISEGFRPIIERAPLIPKNRQLLEETIMDDEDINRPAIGADLRRNLESIIRGGSHV